MARENHTFKAVGAAAAIIILIVVAMALWPTGSRPKAPEFQSAPPPAGILPVYRRQARSNHFALGLVLAKSDGKAYVYVLRGRGWVAQGTGRKADSISVVVKGDQIPAEIITTKTTMGSEIVVVDAKGMPEPVRFGSGLASNEKDILGLVSIESAIRNEADAFNFYRQDLRISAFLKDEGEVVYPSTQRLTLGRQRAGVVYNNDGELIGLLEPIENDRSTLGSVKTEKLERVRHESSEHVPGLDEL